MVTIFFRGYHLVSFFNQVHNDVGCLYILHSAVAQIQAPWGKNVWLYYTWTVYIHILFCWNKWGDMWNRSVTASTVCNQLEVSDPEKSNRNPRFLWGNNMLDSWAPLIRLHTRKIWVTTGNWTVKKSPLIRKVFRTFGEIFFVGIFKPISTIFFQLFGSRKIQLVEGLPNRLRNNGQWRPNLLHHLHLARGVSQHITFGWISCWFYVKFPSKKRVQLGNASHLKKSQTSKVKVNLRKETESPFIHHVTRERFGFSQSKGGLEKETHEVKAMKW